MTSGASEEGGQRAAPARCRIPRHCDRTYGARPHRDGVVQRGLPWQWGEAVVARTMHHAGAAVPRPRDTRAQRSPPEQEPQSW